jgi:pimeloyl-ACP methyl ester carboxylesterase
MATFVLVHGSNGGGWVWKELTPLLRARGHEVYAPTLTGMADRSHVLQCGVSLATHISDVASLLFYEDLSNVILVGNSYAGMVISGVAAKVPERLRTLVYLDAYVPSDGQSEFDLLPSATRAAREADAREQNGLLPPPPPAIFGVSDTALADWIRARNTMQPVSTYSEPVPAGNAQSEAIPRVFIHCIRNPVTTPDLFASSAQKAQANGWRVYELDAGHLAMLTAPRELAELLQNIAGQVHESQKV